ncbi:MAG: hypothetical protein LIO90_06840 [Bacteroidales bacterium]|nr:hypothetical protein [Bacteroidales bacterium]
MNYRKFYTLSAAILCLGFLAGCRPDISRADRLRDLIVESNDSILVVAAGGDAHACAPNSREAIQKAIDKGAQMVFLTLKGNPEAPMMDTDGDVSLAEALDICRGKILVALANPQPYLLSIAETASSTATEGQVVLYDVDAAKEAFLFIPIVDIDEPEVMDRLSRLLTYNPAAVELTFGSLDNPLLPEAVALIKEQGSRVMVDTTNPALCGGETDSVRGQDVKAVYEPLIKMGATVILSDGIKPLINMLHPGSIPRHPQDRPQPKN